jgi:hypothetical protein
VLSNSQATPAQHTGQRRRGRYIAALIRHEIERQTQRLALGLARKVHGPAHGINDHILGFPVAIRSGLAKIRNRGHDQAGIEGFQVGVTQPELWQDMRAKILDHNIDLLDQLPYQLLAAPVL